MVQDQIRSDFDLDLDQIDRLLGSLYLRLDWIYIDLRLDQLGFDLDEQTDKQIDRQIDRQMDGQIDGWMDSQTNKQSIKQTNKEVHGKVKLR